jgi:methylated-DNA-[protein]-cysteine S-methyltransferase
MPSGSKASRVKMGQLKTTPFQERVYALLRTVPRGKVTTYGDLAKALKTSPRAIGQAMRCNPYAPEVPCHRVVASDGRIGGFIGMVRGPQILKKIRMLCTEGVTVEHEKIGDFRKLRMKF